MSEKGNKHQSMTDGSDAVFEFPCTPCEKDSSVEEAIRYCHECKQYLCATCTRYHARFSATTSHRLVDTATLKKQDTGSVPLMPPAKCHTHPDRDIEMYCGSHDMVYCTLCIAKDHRSCIDVAEVGDIASSKLEQSKLHQVIDDIDVVCKNIHAAKIKKIENVKKMHDLKKNLLTEICEIREKMRQHLDTLETKATTELDNLCAKLETELQTEVTTLDDMSSYAGKSKENLSKVIQRNDEQTFVHEKLAEKVTSDARSLLLTEKNTLEKKITFSHDIELYGSLTTATSIGRVEANCRAAVRTPRDNLKVMSKKEIDIRVKDDTQTYRISDICQLPDGTILVADQLNKKVKRLDHYCNVKDYCKFEDEVVSLAYCAERMVVAVKLKSDSIEFLTVGTQLLKTKSINLKGGGNYGLKSCRDKLWVSSGKGIDICDMTGKVEKRIEKDSNGENIFSDLTQNVTMSSDEATSFVAAWGARIVSLDRNGKIQKILSDQRLKGTRGIAISEDGFLFVSGTNSNNIVMFSHDGISLGELVNSSNGIKSPKLLHYDQIKSQLFVGFDDSKIAVFELSE